MVIFMFKHLRRFFIFSSIALISGCGGGGSDTPVSSAEGVWTGTTSNGYKSNVIILENNEFWSVFGSEVSSVLYVRGFDYGTISISGSSVAGPIREFYPNGSSATGTISATLVQGVSLNGSGTSSQGTSTFNLTPIPASSFVYNKSADIAEISGTWSGTFANGAAGSVVINSAGAVSGISQGCTYTGSVAPRTAGKNIFAVNVTFGASPCLLPGQSVSGIGIVYATNTGKKQLVVGALDSSKSLGTLFLAQR